MINLLLPEQKRELKAARLNVVLLRYTFLVAGAILFMLGIFGVGLVITVYEKGGAGAELADYQEATLQYSQVKKNAEVFESNLATAETILSNEIVFSDFLVELARTLPPDLVMSSLAISTESFGEPVSINARTESYDGALILKSTLEASGIFEDVSIVDISRPEDDELEGIAAQYPYVVALSATLSEPSSGDTQ
jgi:Tfp pilus assembly protein PilN